MRETRPCRRPPGGRLAIAWVAALGCVAGACAPPETDSYILTTATTGGTYYPVGVAVATLVTTRLQAEEGISLAAISSAGSEENVKLLRENQAQFAILQGLYGAWARRGEGPFQAVGPHADLRAICMLWSNVEHFVIRSHHTATSTVEDLRAMRGESFSIGARGSGTEGSGRHILTSLGIDPDATLDLVYQGYGASAESLQNGIIQGMNTPAGPPVAAVTQAFATMGPRVALLGFTRQHLERVNAEYGPIWSAYTIEAGTYPGQDEPVTTIAQPNFLAVRADVEERVVHRITQTLYENLGFLHSIHGSTRQMSLETALQGLPFPLHPGAQRYFEEAGVQVPEHLIAGAG